MNQLIDYNLDELKQIFISKGIKSYRANQVFQWIYRGVDDFNQMSDLPKDFRTVLMESFKVGLPVIENILISKRDKTRKYLVKLTDGNIVECVLMKYKHGWSACISSQVGCKMGCVFCASTGIKYMRNISAGEMAGQIIVMQKDVGERISNVVVMGIGEPLDNYDNLVKFLRLINHEKGLNIGMRHISVSTCGLVDKILKLADENLQITLAVSLHAANDNIRDQIMPVNKRNSIDNLLNACKIYSEKTKRRVTLEYALIQGINDSVECAKELGKRLKGMLCHVNLIPMNEIPGTNLRKSKKNDREGFFKTLEQCGIDVTIRREMGADIEAACGQLRRVLLEAED